MKKNCIFGGGLHTGNMSERMLRRTGSFICGPRRFG